MPQELKIQPVARLRLVNVVVTIVNVMQGEVGSHEDDIMQVGLDETLAQEEAAEQDVLAQLRQRAASLERDLLQKALNGLTPNSKVRALQEMCY